MALAVRRISETRSRMGEIKSELADQEKVVSSIREDLVNADATASAKDPEAQKFYLETQKLQGMRDQARVELETLRLDLALEEHGSSALNARAERVDEQNEKHAAAMGKLLDGSGESGISFKELDAEQVAEFVSHDKDGNRQFRINAFAVPKDREEAAKVSAVYRGDSGDGEELVQTDIGMRPVERLKYYGSVKSLAQSFTYMGAGKLEIPIGDQTSTLAVTSGTSSSMVDESYANFNAGERDYNVERKVTFSDYELLVWTKWTDRALRYTQFRNPDRFIRMLETAIDREENRMMSASNIDGSGANRTGVSGVRFMATPTALANNNAITVNEIVKLFFSVDPAYRWGTEDGVMMIEDFATDVVSDPQGPSLAWMAHDSVVESLVAAAANQTAQSDSFQPWYLQWGPETEYRLRLFGLPVYVNNDFGELKSSAASIAVGQRMPVLAFGRWGYMARRNCDYYLREFTNDSNVKMGALQKFGNAAVALSAFDFNCLSVGPTAGKTEAVQALYHK